VNVIVCNTADEMDVIASKEFVDLISTKPNAILGLATGSTPIGLYKKLVQLHKDDKLDFSKVTTFNLDEYVGISQEHACSYHTFMHENLFKYVNLPKENINIPDGQAKNLEEECKKYDQKIEDAGGIDLQILGIGRNGHIGFNEPGTPFDAVTHIVTLDQGTREANSRFFNSIDEVPTKALSMGIKSIMHAQNIILMAKGADKAEAIYNTINGPVTPVVPASVLQLHPNATIILDKEAASRL
jgi:glucosamine-6-phosphate deaminase